MRNRFMDYASEEPHPLAPRPSSMPHSAPGACPELSPALSADAPDSQQLRDAIELVLGNPAALAEIASRRAEEGGRSTRHDGWTGERMATFLRVLAETGLVTEACRSA